MAPYLDHNRHEICEKCAFLHSSICPCPMDYLATLVVEAVESVDQRREHRVHEGEFLAEQAAGNPIEMDEIRRAYAEATGTWTRCDWPTHFGKNGLSLNGLASIEAEAMAVKTAGTVVAADWAAAAGWLAQVQHHASQAEAEAAAAFQAARAGDWPKARRHAEHAWILEFTTGRPVRRLEPPAWLRLRQAIVSAYRAHVASDLSEEIQAQD